MKKTIVVLLLCLILSSSVFAGQILGSNKNLQLEADFAYLLTTGQKARTDKEMSNGEEYDTYFANAIGFKLGAVYDNASYPIDVYADLIFAFPSQYKLNHTSQKTSEVILKSAKENDFFSKYKSVHTVWTMVGFDAGALFDLNVLPNTSLLKLKAGCGLNYNSFNLSNSGKDKYATKQSEIENFKNFGLEIKGIATYNFMGNFYLNASVTPGLSIFSAYHEKTKDGSAMSGTDNSLQFALGFNLSATIGLTCNI